MPRAIFLLGLCGSGKSRLAEKLTKETGAEFHEGVHGRQAWHEVRASLLAGRDCVIEEIYCCTAGYQSGPKRVALTDP